MVMAGIIYSESTNKFHFVWGLALFLALISMAFLPFKLSSWHYVFKEGTHGCDDNVKCLGGCD